MAVCSPLVEDFACGMELHNSLWSSPCPGAFTSGNEISAGGRKGVMPDKITINLQVNTG